MSNASTQQVNRLDRRKARTQAALIRAAQTLIADGRTNVPILEITQAADVGMGSYNHFETKEQLFEAAVEAVMDGYGQLLDNLTADIEDPAEVFACSFRLTGSTAGSWAQPGPLGNVLRLLSADSGLAPRARRDIAAAVEAGFDVEDLDAVTMTARPCSPSASCCTTSRSATSRRRPTGSPRTCCACSAYTGGRLSGSARCPCRTSTGATRRLGGLLPQRPARPPPPLGVPSSRSEEIVTHEVSFSHIGSPTAPGGNRRHL